MNTQQKMIGLCVLGIAVTLGYMFFWSSNSGTGGQGVRATAAQVGGRTRPVRVIVARTAPFSDRIEAIGTVYANESVTLTAKNQGIVRTINFEDGQTVEQGSEIATIDSGEQEAALNVELANLQQQKKELERAQTLVANGHVSQSRVDEQTALLRRAEATVAAARVRSGERRIVAPFSGMVGTRRISVGTLVTPGTAVSTLDDISQVKLDFAIPETFMSSLKPGLPLEASASAYPGRKFTGQVVSIDSRIDPVTRSVNVRAILKNPQLLLRPGMLMVVELIKDQRQSITIPEAALQPENNRQYVFVVRPDASAARVEITLGRRGVGEVEILSGLNPGDQVIYEGMQDLRTGAKVNVVNASELTPPPAPTPAQDRPS